MPTNERDPLPGSVTPDTSFDTYRTDDLTILALGVLMVASDWISQSLYLLFCVLPWAVVRWRRRG